MMLGLCADKHVVCTLVTPGGLRFIGTNGVVSPQLKCPRLPGEGYDKCLDICGQIAHAEVAALQAAGHFARGSTAYLQGCGWYCRDCQEKLFTAGVVALRLGAPPDD